MHGIFSNKLAIIDFFPQLKENAAILPNSNGGVVVQKGKKITACIHRKKSYQS
jgi:hypothetical protein